jgi:HK97 family phage major capsid protein
MAEETSVSRVGEPIQFRDLFRAQNVTTATAGGFTTQTDVGEIVDALKPYSAVLTAGARLIALTYDTSYPRINSLANASWGSETATASDSTDLAFSARMFTPHRITCTVSASNQLLSQTGGAAEAALLRNVQAAVGYAIDVAALNGAGSVEPVGILQDSDVSQTQTFGGAVTLAKLTPFEQAIGDAFAEPPAAGSLTFISSQRNACQVKERPRVYGKQHRTLGPRQPHHRTQRYRDAGDWEHGQ